MRLQDEEREDQLWTKEASRLQGEHDEDGGQEAGHASPEACLLTKLLTGETEARFLRKMPQGGAHDAPALTLPGNWPAFKRLIYSSLYCIVGATLVAPGSV